MNNVQMGPQDYINPHSNKDLIKISHKERGPKNNFTTINQGEQEDEWATTTKTKRKATKSFTHKNLNH